MAKTKEKLPSAELSEGQFDPFDYKIVSPLVDRIIEYRESPLTLMNDGYDPQLVYDIYNRIKANEYKRRQTPPGIRISGRAFGRDWRYPITSHYSFPE